MELLCLKHENMELAFDSLVMDMNDRMIILNKNKSTLGKRNVVRDRKEALRSWLESTLEKFGQASFDLQAALDKANEALYLDWKN